MKTYALLTLLSSATTYCCLQFGLSPAAAVTVSAFAQMLVFVFDDCMRKRRRLKLPTWQ